MEDGGKREILESRVNHLALIPIESWFGSSWSADHQMLLLLGTKGKAKFGNGTEPYYAMQP